MRIRKYIGAFVLVFVVGMLPSLAFAQIGGYGIPSTYVVFGDNIASGDIVSFDPDRNIYELSASDGDKNVFGVIDTAPVVVFRTNEASRVPVVQVGQVLVNVTTTGGPIAVGDQITTSRIPGKGKRLESGDSYILGYALESFDDTTTTTTITVGGKTVTTGPIPVLLSIGPAPDVKATDQPLAPATIFVKDNTNTATGLETIFRYITAALFTLGTIFVVLKTFGPNVGKGVVSIGRNPLAKTSIQAMVIFNVILILAISTVAFIVSLLIIFLPL